MNDFLYSIDRAAFNFVNHSLQNWVFDAVMPFLTDLNKSPVVLALVGILWIAAVVRGGKHGRIAAILLVPTILLSDQLNSAYVKHIFERVRPCHVLEDVRLLVSCGSGYSFPSSHAVNNFAGAFVLAYFVRRAAWAFWAFAATVAFSRVYVGVHYPADVVAGAILGIGCGAAVVIVYERLMWFQRSRRSYLPQEQSNDTDKVTDATKYED